MTYVGRNPCGCIAFLVVDEPTHAKPVAREVARGIREGMTIERVATEWVRTPACTLQPCHDSQPCVRDAQRIKRRVADRQGALL